MDAFSFKRGRMGRSGMLAALLCGSVALSRLLGAAPAPSTNAIAGPRTNSVPVPPAEVAAQIENTSANLQEIEGALASDPSISEVQADLPGITREINFRIEENSRIINRNPSLENLRRLNTEWQGLKDELSDWNRTLTKHATQLESELERLHQVSQTWQKTHASADRAKLPPELVKRMEDMQVQIQETQAKVEAQHADILVLQSRVSEQHARASQAVKTIERVRTEMLHRLFLRDSPPIWSASLWSRQTSDLLQQGQRSLSLQTAALIVYAQRKAERFLLQALLILTLLGALLWIRNRLGTGTRTLAGLEHAALLVDAPFSTALVLGLLFSGWIYPQAPRLLWPILGAVAIVPATALLRRLVDGHLIPILGALIAFYFLDQLRTVAASQPLVSRGLFLAENLGGALFVGWLIRSKRLCDVPEAKRDLLWKTIQVGARVALAAFALALLANGLGRQSLSKLLCSAVLASAYLGLALYAAARVLDSLMLGVLGSTVMGRLQVVRRHRHVIHTRASRFVGWIAFAVWLVAVLEAVALRGLAFRSLKQVWMIKAALGSFSFTIGDIVLFGLTVWAAFFISGILRFILEEEVYPRVQLAPGLYYSISQMLHYVVLLAGFLIGVAMLGVNLTKLTILVGAFGVGIGFGLQNIINNFVSGIILLFERPVKVGDLIQLENNEGVVKSIGIRASVVRTINGSEIVVPNGKLISDPLTNWTFSNRQRLVNIPIAVAADSSSQQVIDLLKKVAANHPSVVKDPPPEVFVVGLGGGSLNLELRAWTNQFEDWSHIRSDVALAINSALTAQKISTR